MHAENLLTNIQPLAIIQKYYAPDSAGYRVLVTHSILVAARALELARAWQQRHPAAMLELRFIEEAALLHDLGIFRCHAPELHCFGTEPYIKHGVLGRELLEQEGLPQHALVCERHTGVGLTRDEVLQQDLPLPQRDYLPVSLAEKFVCLADRFYVKDPDRLYEALSLAEIGEKIAKFGAPALARWEELRQLIAE